MESSRRDLLNDMAEHRPIWKNNQNTLYSLIFQDRPMFSQGSCHKRQKPQAPTPQAPIRNRQTRKVANAKGLNRNTNLA